MKKLLLGAAALTFAFASCKKDDNNSNNNNGSTGNNTIKVGSNSYTYGGTGTYFQATGSLVQISALNGTNTASLILAFPGSTAPVAGTYRVVAADSGRNANQVTVVASTTVGGSNLATYKSTGVGTVNVTVTMNNGKYTIVMPDAPVTGANGTSGTNTVSMNATQK